MGLSHNVSSTQQINTLIAFLCWHDRPFLSYNILVFFVTDCQALIYVLYVYAWF